MAQSQSLTVTSTGGLLRVLQTPCRIAAAFDPSTVSQLPQHFDFTAIWDTGASGSVITQSVIDACGLKPIGLTQVHDASGARDSGVYLVNIMLPNSVAFVAVSVTTGKLAPGSDVLIGMDIITLGDFSVTNKDGRTIFSFRVPSQLHVDYVQEHNSPQPRRPSGFGHGQMPRPRRPK
jgi:predicted aspartyl protease